MNHNLAALGREERDKINVDFSASGVAYKEHINMPFVPHEAEMQQPADLRDYFKERLQHYRNVALQFPRGSDPVYQKDADK
ncbi:DNA polymerase III subunit theta [Pantoea endophytica]|uniref:DNA polymerase III subunit theta n=1 Tax=Pantoea endophytica TaxID=92488 RepID=A0ABX4SVU5_9GAMM|nr:DNA polymerase III subunit theta [Pantoea endophytica]PLR26484.1 DNA polymerase III subunit theta [Pantoea endophytica]